MITTMLRMKVITVIQNSRDKTQRMPYTFAGMDFDVYGAGIRFERVF
jgi:hypothetical protein